MSTNYKIPLFNSDTEKYRQGWDRIFCEHDFQFGDWLEDGTNGDVFRYGKCKKCSMDKVEELLLKQWIK